MRCLRGRLDKPRGAKLVRIRNQRMLDEGKPDLSVAFPAVAAPPTWFAEAGKQGYKLLR